MTGGAKAHDDRVVAFSQTDFTKDFPHGMPTTQAETINADLLNFLQF